MELAKKEACTGCGLCYELCKNNAVQYNEDSLGFRHYSIDTNKCVECGLCVKKCPANQTVDKSDVEECYIAWSKDDETHFESSSGGISIELGKWIINQGGYVCGCTWDDQYNAIITVVETIEDLNKIRGSKYVQSYIIEETYREIRRRDKLGQMGIAIALPCQIAALRNLKLKHLYLVDILCHGSCSPWAFSEHIKFIRHKYKINDLTNITFRGGKYDCNMTFWTGSQVAYRGAQFVDEYFYSFMKHSLLRDSCYKCVFARRERISDMTIADFWGIDPDFIKDKHIMNGSNLIIVNTTSGQEQFKQISNVIEFYEREVDEAIDGNDTLKQPTIMPEDRETDIFNVHKYGFIKGIHKDRKWRKIIVQYSKAIKKSVEIDTPRYLV